MDFYNYPHTNLNEQNQDWLIQQMKSLVEEYKNFKNPEVVHFADEMTNENKIYIYEGTESGYLTDYWYYYNEDTRVWVAGGPYGMGGLPSLDTTLTMAGHPADAKAVGDAIADVESYELYKVDFGSISSFPATINNSHINGNTKIISISFNNPSAITSDITWTTNNGNVVLNGTIAGSTAGYIIFAKTN